MSLASLHLIVFPGLGHSVFFRVVFYSDDLWSLLFGVSKSSSILFSFGDSSDVFWAGVRLNCAILRRTSICSILNEMNVLLHIWHHVSQASAYAPSLWLFLFRSIYQTDRSVYYSIQALRHVSKLLVIKFSSVVGEDGSQSSKIRNPMIEDGINDVRIFLIRISDRYIVSCTMVDQV